ncbi:unnamed protein product [Zymoseptoria tritici ST99CH_3D7]|uniref:Uncharacterized protein n=1 Tax=Zymoseptoria tritici (strain ST99CH_3D7) TaxID=1276538 RepID=A0A1X7RI33_ZYMT9|nr:unnamed protein product [Zymoseptoria tritici ST99CH_3D7]
MATSPAGGSPRLRTSERVPSTPSPGPPPTASAIQPCPLLGLSAELRNNVWELAYTFRKESGTETDLLGDQCPTTALLLTCRQIKSEAIGFFEAAESRYWEQDLFVLEHVITTIYAVGSELADIPWPRPRPSVGIPTEEDVSTMPEVMNAPPLAPREKIVQAWGAMVKCAGFVWKGMHVFEVCTVRTTEVTLGSSTLHTGSDEEIAA